jgi:hypothetical protein
MPLACTTFIATRHTINLYPIEPSLQRPDLSHYELSRSVYHVCTLEQTNRCPITAHSGTKEFLQKKEQGYVQGLGRCRCTPICLLAGSIQVDEDVDGGDDDFGCDEDDDDPFEEFALLS